MPLTLIRYGRYATAAEADYGVITAGTMRACVFDAATDNMWVRKIGLWGGRAGGSAPSVKLGLYEADASKNPDDRVAYTDTGSGSTSMAGAGGGAEILLDVTQSDNGPSSPSGDAMIFSGRRYAIAALATSQSLGHSMIAAGSISADNEQFYDRSGLPQPPPDPFGAYSASVEGHLTAWVEGYRNAQPEAPSNGIYPTGTINETAPVFTADFDDLNGTFGGFANGDKLNQYKVQLRQVGTTTLLWNQTYSATSGEKAADAVSRAYGGSALTRGVQYEWRIWMSDMFDDASSYSNTGSGTGWFTFTPANLGFVTLDSDPTGKIESVTPDFKGRWNHQSATTMKTVQARLKSSTGTVLQTGADYNIADVASSAAPGTLFTIPWASSGFTTLAWGTSYRYEIRGFDGTQWSDWSTYRTFSTNKAPSVPTSLVPASSAIFTGYPKLTCSFTDLDDTTGTGLTGVFRITRPDTSTVDVTPTYNATSGLWEYQTTAVQITAVGTYSWKATGYDGTIYSGEAAALGSATWSSSATFIYATGPTVTVTTPADLATIATASLTVGWSVSGGTQAKYQVLVYEDGGSVPIYDSLLNTSTATSHEIPSGYLRNGTSYDIVVQITDTTPLVGYSSIVNIAVSFTPPTAVANFQAMPIEVGLDPFATAIRLSWDQTGYAAPDFVEYTLSRWAEGGPDAAEIILARITSPSTVAFIDYTPASGFEYTYGITVSTQTGADTIESDRVSAAEIVTLVGTVLSLVGNPGTYRSCLLNVRDRVHDRKIDEAVYQALTGSNPVTIRSRTRFWDSTFAGAFVIADDASAKQRRDELDALDTQDGVICYRDGRGIKRFCKITDFKIKDELPDWYSYTFGLREENASEGES